MTKRMTPVEQEHRDELRSYLRYIARSGVLMIMHAPERKAAGVCDWFLEDLKSQLGTVHWHARGCRVRK